MCTLALAARRDLWSGPTLRSATAVPGSPFVSLHVPFKPKRLRIFPGILFIARQRYFEMLFTHLGRWAVSYLVSRVGVRCIGFDRPPYEAQTRRAYPRRRHSGSPEAPARVRHEALTRVRRAGDNDWAAHPPARYFRRRGVRGSPPLRHLEREQVHLPVHRRD